jgi:anaphase-promoting complex subunit 2
MFLELLHWYFKGRLEELSTIMDGEFNGGGDDASQDKDDMDLDEMGKMLHRNGAMDIDESCLQGKFTENNNLVKNIGKVVRDLRSLGFTSMTEDAYASAIFLLLKVSA